MSNAKPSGISAETARSERRNRAVVVAAGETSQAELLHARLAPLVNRLLWSFLGPDPERDDIAHDIFVKILRGVHDVRDSSRLEAWAMRVTMNSIKNEFRRRKVRKFFSFEALTDEQHPRVHPDFEGRERLARTQAILEHLPTEERLAVTLRLFEQASAERIAEVCSFSVRTAKRRLASGSERFRRLAQHDRLVWSRLAESNGLEEANDE